MKVCVILGCSEWSWGDSLGSWSGCKGQSTSWGLAWGLLSFLLFHLLTRPWMTVGQVVRVSLTDVHRRNQKRPSHRSLDSVTEEGLIYRFESVRKAKCYSFLSFCPKQQRDPGHQGDLRSGCSWPLE